jgi:2-methylcitrate dehydratase PrpD
MGRGQPTQLDLTAAIARHVANTPFSALPPATVAATRRSLLDGIGVMLAASGMSAEVRPFIATARGMGGPRQASILGHWDRLSAPAAAFANGAMAHALDYEDAFDAAPTHPNASLIPAALAVAQAHGPVSGETFLTAMAVGCDLTCRLALSAGAGLEEGGWYPPPILGAFGAVAAVARLMQLEAHQVSAAFSLMLCQTACPGEIKYSTASAIRAVREAFPAQAAVLSAALAAQGIQGFSQPFEGRGGFFRLFASGRFEVDPLLEGLGTRFCGERLSLKPWPCCRGTHAYIEAAQLLRRRHGFHWRDIADIRLTTGVVQRMLCEPTESKRAPASAIAAKFSLPFTVASALIHPQITLDSFSPDALADPDVGALACRVDFDYRSEWGRENAASGAVRIQLQDGLQLYHEVEQALGHPDAPLDTSMLRGKFLDCAMRAARPCTPMQAEDLCARILSLETSADVGRSLTEGLGLDGDPVIV